MNPGQGDGGMMSRKFLLACAGLLISTALVLLGKMDDVVFVSFNSILAGVYMTSNVAAKRVMK